MLLYILRRLGYGVITLFFVSLLTFFIIELAPGSAVDSEIERLRAMGSTVSTEQVEALEEQYGANDPWIVKYGKWVSGLLQRRRRHVLRLPRAGVRGDREPAGPVVGPGPGGDPGGLGGCHTRRGVLGDPPLHPRRQRHHPDPVHRAGYSGVPAGPGCDGGGRAVRWSGCRRTVLQRVPQRTVEHGQVRRHGRPPLDAGAGDLGRQHGLAHPGDAGEPVRRAWASSSFRRREPKVSPNGR